ncbi:hypothetical protein [Streptomyces nigrescens]|uniref:hypothetical protein n=1 Tax=Streptomyces nigrescens TaxID=1920 RepID=UPI00347B0094
MREISTHTLQRRFDGREDTPVVITSKAPHPYQRLMMSYDEPGHPVVHTISTVRP